MRLVILICSVFFCELVIAQTAPLKYWVQFSDKDNSAYSISNPEEFLSSETVARRKQFGIAIIEQDLPVNQEYIDAVDEIEGVRIVHSSKWFNAVTVQLEDSSFLNTAVPALQAISNVISIKSAQVYRDEKRIIPNYYKSADNEGSYTTIYGPSYNQIAIHEGHLLHEIGLQGNGMKIGVFDSGFYGVNFLKAFEKLREEDRIKFQYDVVDDDVNISNGGNHGKSVLSIMTAFMPDSLIGSAPMADYYLFRTEDASSEFITEEDNWIRAMEMADSIGIQIINSSLGYTTFDDSLQNHSYDDMDGNTTRISIAADIAASKGILLVNSAGNSGDDDWFYIGAPADADSILTVGAVSDTGEYAWFSSRGPSSDGDVKPNVVGVGSQTVYANLSEGISTGNGTSFSSPIIAGLTACLWQSFPDKSNMEIIQAIEESAHLYGHPNDSLGNGIPNFYGAYKQLLSSERLSDLEVLTFPNPFSDEINVLYDQSITELRLFDYLGRKVVYINQAALGNEAVTIQLDSEVRGLPTGSYTLSAYSEGKLHSNTRIVKISN